MLDRASTCLESGSRHVLRAPKLGLHNRRTLHATLWHHSFHDMRISGLLEYATCPTGTSMGLPHKKVKADREDVDNTAQRQHGILLDFLYPIKAMAQIRHMSGYKLDRRGCRKHPSHHHNRRQFSSTAWRAYVIEDDADNTNESTENFGRTPKSNHYSHHADPLGALKTLLESKTEKNQELAWQLFSQLRSPQLTNYIRADLLDYLGFSRRPIDAERCLHLFEKLPILDRRPTSYRAAITAVIDLGMVGRAIAIHAEAAENHSGTNFGSDILLARTIMDKQWDLSLQVIDKCGTYWIQGENSQAAVLKSVSKRVNIIATTESLLEFAKQTHLSDQEKFCKLASFIPMIMQIIVGHAADIDGSKLISIFRSLQDLGLSKWSYYEDILFLLLSSSRHAEYSNKPKPLIELYKLYRSEAMSKGSLNWFRPSRRLLEVLLTRLANFYSDQSADLAVTASSLVSDWRYFHGHLSRKGLLRLMIMYARMGHVQKVEAYFKELQQTSGNKIKNVTELYPLLTVYATLGQVEKTKQQFIRISEEFNLIPDTVCWNTLLQSYKRADDLEGLFSCFDRMTASDVPVDLYSFTPLLQLAAERGDPDTVQELFGLLESMGIEQSVASLTTLVLANLNNNDPASAESAAQYILSLQQAGQVKGSLTPTWNQLLTAYALKRDRTNFVRIYRQMIQHKIQFDSLSYAAIIQSLVLIRQANAAEAVLRQIMPKDIVRTLALHYSIVMAGYISQGEPEKALRVYSRMLKRAIKPTIGVKKALVRASVLVEMKGPSQESQSFYPRSEDLIDTLLMGIYVPKPGPKQPISGLASTPLPQAMSDSYFEFLISKYSDIRAFDSIRGLLSKYKEAHTQLGTDQTKPGIRLLSSLMNAYRNAGRHEEVEECWKVAQAGMMQLIQLPGSTAFGKSIISQTLSSSTKPDSSSTRPSNLAIDGETSPSIAIPRRHLLARPLEIYFSSLFAQGDFNKIQNTVNSHLAEGFTLNNNTWNQYVQTLARSGNVLEAFTICENYLIPNFPGWRLDRNPQRNIRGYEWMHVREGHVRRPGVVKPRYRTLVVLAAGLIRLRKMEMIGSAERGGTTAPLVTNIAPKTVAIVNAIPKIRKDVLQNRFLGRTRN